MMKVVVGVVTNRYLWNGLFPESIQKKTACWNLAVMMLLVDSAPIGLEIQQQQDDLYQEDSTASSMDDTATNQDADLEESEHMERREDLSMEVEEDRLHIPPPKDPIDVLEELQKVQEDMMGRGNHPQ
jgi:hypothetical protein